MANANVRVIVCVCVISPLTSAVNKSASSFCANNLISTVLSQPQAVRELGSYSPPQSKPNNESSLVSPCWEQWYHS